MMNLLEQAISADDRHRAAEINKYALSIESDGVVNYPSENPLTVQRSSIIGEWARPMFWQS